VDADGRYFLNGKGPVDPGVMEEQLKAMYAARTEDKIVYFKADNQLKFGRIQEAVELARRSGARVMAAITEPEIQGGLFDAAVKEN
jgi:biopolymer transport protein ExbD